MAVYRLDAGRFKRSAPIDRVEKRFTVSAAAPAFSQVLGRARLLDALQDNLGGAAAGGR
jgi:hypothetical protein